MQVTGGKASLGASYANEVLNALFRLLDFRKLDIPGIFRYPFKVPGNSDSIMLLSNITLKK